MVVISSFFIFITVIAAFIAVLLLPQKSDTKLLLPIKIIERDDNVERFLKKYISYIGKDYDAYRNHIYRVLTYSIHFLHGSTNHLDTIAAALVFHDIGLWTNSSLAYIKPSCELAKRVMKKAKMSPRQVNLAQDIIYYHHKIFDFEDVDGSKINAEVVNAVRKADWIDASMGLIQHGMPKVHIQNVTKTIPTYNFHGILAGFGPRLRGWNLYAIITELGSIFRL